jgi:exoribonuclease R
LCERLALEHLVLNNSFSNAVQEVDAPPDTFGRMPTGTVVSITTRNWRQRGYAGSLRPSDNITQGRSASLLFAPIERRFPFIRVTTRQAATLMDKRIVVVVDEWPADSQYPLGHYRQTIGTIGDEKPETEVQTPGKGAYYCLPADRCKTAPQVADGRCC